jgi:hypothetical protein
MGTAVEEDGMAEVGTVEREPLLVSVLDSGCLVGLWLLPPTMRHPITQHPATATPLLQHYTGVGRPVFDLFTSAGISPVGVLITGGAVETHDGAIYGVPKLTLVSRLQALLHEGRLKIHKELSEAETLVRELQDFRVDFTAAGHLTFNARSGRHDDLVLALAIAVWHAHRGMASAGSFELARRRAAALGVPSDLGPLFRRGRPRAKPRPDGDRGGAEGQPHRSGRCGGGWPKTRARLGTGQRRMAASAGRARGTAPSDRRNRVSPRAAITRPSRDKGASIGSRIGNRHAARAHPEW